MAPFPQRLADALNLYFEIGCNNFTRHEVLAYGGIDSRRVEECLRGWQAKGFLDVLKPIVGAEDAEVIVKVLKRIEAPVFYHSLVPVRQAGDVDAVDVRRAV